MSHGQLYRLLEDQGQHDSRRRSKWGMAGRMRWPWGFHLHQIIRRFREGNSVSGQLKSVCYIDSGFSITMHILILHAGSCCILQTKYTSPLNRALIPSMSIIAWGNHSFPTVRNMSNIYCTLGFYHISVWFHAALYPTVS